MSEKCPVPNCPAEKRWPKAVPDPNCRCGTPIWIVIPAGGHIHPCPVHPDYVVYGDAITLHRDPPNWVGGSFYKK